MPQPVVIENEHWRVQVWPHLGGKIASIIDKADRFELLFNFPSEIPAGPVYDSPYTKGWYAGWDECFPAVAGGNYVGHPYDRIPIPDHGELWGLPAMSVPAKGGITTVWHGLRFGYRLTRQVALEGNELVAQYSLVNVAPFDFRFVWAAHALLSFEAAVEIDLPGGIPFRYSHDVQGVDYQQAFTWPRLGESLDFSRLGELPPRMGWKLFSMGPIAEVLTLRYPGRGRSLRVAYTSADGMNAYWGIWITTGGFSGQRIIAIEPTTGRFDQLDRAVRDGSAGLVPASGRRDWAVRWTLG